MLGVWCLALAISGARGFLVGQGGATRLTTRGNAAEVVAPPPPPKTVFDGKTDLDIGAWAPQQQSVSGVYVVRDVSASVRYVGASRDVAFAVDAHRRRFGADVASTVRVLEKQAAVDELEKMRRKVLDTFATVPPGNADPELGWDEIVSPFARDDRLRAPKTHAGEFTLENVDAVLDGVRPLLVADGGNVDVVSVDASDKSVVLSLRGACGSCPSATTTVKNGLEKALRNAWPDLGRVSRVDDPTIKLTAQEADALLDPIRPAFTSLGATATVLSANLLGPGVVELEYAGPDNVRYGIELSLLASPLVTDVRWLVVLPQQQEESNDGGGDGDGPP